MITEEKQPLEEIKIFPQPGFLLYLREKKSREKQSPQLCNR